jgi:hypothetical protein
MTVKRWPFRPSTALWISSTEERQGSYIQSNMTLHAPQFAGAVLMNGVPVVNEGSQRMIQTMGGIISLNNTNGAAYFGCVLSVNPAGDQRAFYVGNPAGAYTVVGVLLNEQGIRMNDPAKPTYIMNELPATAVTRGRLWYSSWDTTFAGALTLPAPGCRVVYRIATGGGALYAGQIGFMLAAAAVPGTHLQLQAAVLSYSASLGADIDFFIPVAS